MTLNDDSHLHTENLFPSQGSELAGGAGEMERATEAQRRFR